MATEYFGQLTGTAAVAVVRSYRSKDQTYACVNGGSLASLEAWVKSNGGTPGNIRVALYSADGSSLIAQGSAEVAVTSTTAGWVGHVAFVDSAGSPVTPTLSSSTNYIIAVTQDSTDVVLSYETGGAAAFSRTNSEYTGGFPSSAWTTTDTTVQARIRIGVEVGGGGSSSPSSSASSSPSSSASSSESSSLSPSSSPSGSLSSSVSSSPSSSASSSVSSSPSSSLSAWDTDVAINWVWAPDGADTVTFWRIKYGTETGVYTGQFDVEDETARSANLIDFLTLTDVYYLVVVACNGEGEGTVSNEIVVDWLAPSSSPSASVSSSPSSSLSPSSSSSSSPSSSGSSSMSSSPSSSLSPSSSASNSPSSSLSPSSSVSSSPSSSLSPSSSVSSSPSSSPSPTPGGESGLKRGPLRLRLLSRYLMTQ